VRRRWRAIENQRVLAEGARRCAPPLLERGEAPGIVGLDFETPPRRGRPTTGRVSKAALESINRYLARDLGPRGVRSNLVAAGPLQTIAASNIDASRASRTCGSARRRGLDLSDPTPVADACLFLLSPLARADHGGDRARRWGVHAVGAGRAGARRGGRRSRGLKLSIGLSASRGRRWRFVHAYDAQGANADRTPFPTAQWSRGGANATRTDDVRPVR